MTNNEYLLPIPAEVDEVLRESNFIKDLDSFVIENQNLLTIHSHLSAEHRRTPSLLMTDFAQTENSGWRFVPNENVIEPLMGVQLGKNVIDSKGREMDLLYIPILSAELFANESGLFGRRVVGGDYAIYQGYVRLEDEKSTSVSYRIIDENPSLAEISVTSARYNNPYLSFRMSIDRKTGDLLEYDSSSWGNGKPPTVPSVKRLIYIFTRFKDKWSQYR